MDNVTEYFKQAELAFAAYADLESGVPSTDELKRDTVGMSPTQATHFAATYDVVDRKVDMHGLSVTLFQRHGSSEQYVAIRGTDDGLDLLTDYLDIVLLGTAQYQHQYASLSAYVQQWLDEGKLTPGFTLTGHSLGGFLAAALTVEYAGQVSHTYLYNTPGLAGVAAPLVSIWNALNPDSALIPPTTLPITNLKADAGLSPLAGLGLPVVPPVLIHIENQLDLDVSERPLALNHSQQVLTDALAVYGLFGMLDPNVTVETVTQIVQATSNENAGTLEAALAALGRVFGKDYPQTQTTREALYANLYDLRGGLLFTQEQGLVRVESLAGLTCDTLVSRAQADLAYRFALATLNPFALTGDASLYTQHNAHGELDRYDPATGQGNLSDLYLQDRAAMLSWKIKYDMGALDADDALTRAEGVDKPYTQDWDTWSIAGDWDFVDHAAGITLSIDGQGPNALQTDPNHQIVFGSDDAETLMGGETSDHLYGGSGNDTLNGGAGADHLEGNLGDDTYFFNRGDGQDTINDYDTTIGNTDVLRLGAGISFDQLWLKRSGTNLEASVIGTADKVTIQNWYAGSANHVERFEAGGRALLDSKVDLLVQAMAAFTPPAAGQSTLPDNYRQALAPVLAANWQ